MHGILVRARRCGHRGKLAISIRGPFTYNVNQVVDIIMSSLIVESTAVPRKLARLFLVCDILHNSAATIPNAWKFRQEFERRLPVVFDHLSDIYKSFPGRMTANTFKQQVVSVVEVWEDWIVFPPDFTTDLRLRLEGVAGQTGQASDTARSSIEASVNDDQSRVRMPEAPMKAKFKAGGFAAVNPVDRNGGNDDVDGMEVDGDDLEGEAIPIDVGPSHATGGDGDSPQQSSAPNPDEGGDDMDESD